MVSVREDGDVGAAGFSGDMVRCGDVGKEVFSCCRGGFDAC